MAYNQTYQAGDFTGILTDIFGTAGVQVLGYIGLIVLVFIITWGVRRLKRR